MALSQSRYNKIRKWMYRNARPLELALFQFHFELEGKERVIDALKAFQNEDGGFGHGLMSEYFNPNSSPMQTWYATEVLYTIGERNAQCQIIKDILEYLDNSTDYNDGLWHGIISSNNNYPHAAPWHYSEESSKKKSYTPTAALAGFVLYFGDRESSLYKRAEAIASEAVQYYLSNPLLECNYESLCFIRLLQYCTAADINHLFHREQFEHKLRLQVRSLIEQNREGFSRENWFINKNCRPSHFFHSSESIFYKDNKEIADQERRYILQSTNLEGIWDIKQCWEDFPQEEAISSIALKSNLILSNLRYLKGMGQLNIAENRTPEARSY